MNTKIRTFCFAVAALAAFPAHVALSDIDAKDFDFDKNGTIDPGPEITALLRHANSKIYGQMDKNKNGIIEASEKKKYEENLNLLVQDNLDEYASQRGERPALPVVEARKIFTPQKPKRTSLGGLLIREKHEDVTVLDKGKSFEKATGTILSFTRDIEQSNTAWTARGAVLYPFRIPLKAYPDFNATVLTAYSIVPSVSFDRLKNSKDDSKDVNSLTFRLGSEFEFGGGGLFDLQYARANLAYATDFDLDTKVPAVEMQWEPIKSDWGIGSGRDISGIPLEYRVRFIAHSEWGRTQDTGGNANLSDDETFVRVGPKFELELWPTVEGLERFSSHVKWSYLRGLTGEPENSDLLETGLTYRLDAAGHAQVEASYRNGETPLIKRDVEAFHVGIGVKF